MDFLTAAYDLIGNLGFPIAMVAYFIWDKATVSKQMMATIDNNTKALTLLLDKFNATDLVVGG